MPSSTTRPSPEMSSRVSDASSSVTPAGEKEVRPLNALMTPSGCS